METVLLVVYVLVAAGLIGLILLQQGKGAGVGASFGAGASQTVFGSAGSGNFLTRITGILAALFFVISLGLAYSAKVKINELSAAATEAATVPAAPAADVPMPAGQMPALPVAPAGDVPVVPGLPTRQ